MYILVIEDEISTLQSIERTIKAQRWSVECVSSGEDGLEVGTFGDYDLIILDLMLPDINGMEVLKRIRAANVNTPVLILSGIDQHSQKICGLTSGADDYLTKPFKKEELIARINAIVRRYNGHANSVIQIGNLEIKPDSHELFIDGKEIKLTCKEHSIMELLALRKGSTVTKYQFLNHLYGGIDEPDMKIVDVFICKLRKKIAKFTMGKNYIETIWGRGYSLVNPELKNKSA